MEADVAEKLQEAVDLIQLSLEQVDDSEVIDHLEAAVEIIEDAERDLELGAEMDELLSEHGDNIEGMDEL